MRPEKLARWMHDQYEEIAKKEKWATQKIKRVRFEDLPEENRKVMLELAKRLIIKFANNKN